MFQIIIIIEIMSEMIRLNTVEEVCTLKEQQSLLFLWKVSGSLTRGVESLSHTHVHTLPEAIIHMSICVCVYEWFV